MNKIIFFMCVSTVFVFECFAAVRENKVSWADRKRKYNHVEVQIPVDPFPADTQILSPFHFAARSNNLDQLSHLTKCKFSTHAVPQSKKGLPHMRCIDAPNKAGITAVYEAAFHNNTEAVEALCKLEANVNIQTTNGYTALHCAAVHNNCDMINCLIKYNADVNAKTKQGDTPLRVALDEKALDAVMLLEKAGAWVLIDDPSYTVLHYAAACGLDKILQEHLSLALDVNIQTIKGDTPLIVAAEGDELEAIQRLCQAGADPNICNNKGLLPIIWAVINDNDEMIRVLHSHNADINIQIEHISLLEYAENENLSNAAAALQSLGAK